MNILIVDSWLREYLDTKASPKKISDSLSLSGPSVEKVQRHGKDWVYDIEITTNRVDSMSIYGIAREAVAILPEFNIKAHLKPLKVDKITNNKKLDLKIVNDPKLCKRILAVKLSVDKLKPSPEWLQERLKAVGARPLNGAIDVTNYVMWEIGHPIHVFDYDRLTTKKIIVREARKGEEMITLDKKKYKLNGGEVIFDNSKGEIVDLPGIMGTTNSVVTSKTKNILLWIESVDPVKIRQASMGLAIRSQAAVLNEKSVDPELGLTAILRATDLLKSEVGAKVTSKLVDIYPQPYKAKTLKTSLDFINSRLGINLPQARIKNILTNLSFKAKWQGKTLIVKIPSFRANDIAIPEDIVEEVARIYGYHNLPSVVMQGELPKTLKLAPFKFERAIKSSLKALGGVEIYTQSMVVKRYVDKKALKLKNPMGASAYMRTSLRPSLLKAVKSNSGYQAPFHLFEIANSYQPQEGKLPIEKMTLAGIFSDYEYRRAKGVVESLLANLHIDYKFEQQESKNYTAGRRLLIEVDKKPLGEFGILETDEIYYQFDLLSLQKVSKRFATYKPIPKYPAQIEDITLHLPANTRVGKVVNFIASQELIVGADLTGVYKDNYTIRVKFQHPSKTLTNSEVEKKRSILLNNLKAKFGGVVR